MTLFKKKEEAEAKKAEAPSEEVKTWSGPKWEYKTEMLVGLGGKFMIDKLNELGGQGWEAVNAFYDSKHSQTYVLLKRPKI